jgi:hypothetical protein
VAARAHRAVAVAPAEVVDTTGKRFSSRVIQFLPMARSHSAETGPFFCPGVQCAGGPQTIHSTGCNVRYQPIVSCLAAMGGVFSLWCGGTSVQPVRDVGRPNSGPR